MISTHAPRMRSDTANLAVKYIGSIFQSTPPHGERRLVIINICIGIAISIHAPCMESDRQTKLAGSISKLFQSTLPVWGATQAMGKQRTSHNYISIHAPCMGSDMPPVDGGDINTVFQSTLPVWGATSLLSSIPRKKKYFNPRSLYGERHWAFAENGTHDSISIHAPCMGSDQF